MTEDQAIERIAKAIKALSSERTRVNRWDLGCAEAAWNEMKAIAREGKAYRNAQAFPCDYLGQDGAYHRVVRKSWL